MLLHFLKEWNEEVNVHQRKGIWSTTSKRNDNKASYLQDCRYNGTQTCASPLSTESNPQSKHGLVYTATQLVIMVVHINKSQN